MLCYLGLGNDFLDISPEVQAVGKKEQNLKPLCFNGHYQDKSKNKAGEEKENICIFENSLISRVHTHRETQHL